MGQCSKNFYQYDVFGNLLEKREDASNCILYTGQQYDQEMGQYYLRARYYNPVVGRFLQEDIYRGDGLNLYAYCANNPVVYYDPRGLEQEDYIESLNPVDGTPAGKKTDFVVTPKGSVMDTGKNYNLVGTGEKGDWF